MADVLKFANEAPKYRLANVELSSIKALRNAKEGDRLFTKKGNTIYIIKAYDKALNELCAEDKAFVEACNRKGMKCVGISAVRDVTHYEDWCSGTSKEVINSLSGQARTGCGCSAEKTKNNMMNKSMKETLLSKIKSQFLPTRVSSDDVRLTFNGDVAVINPDRDGFRVISSTGELVEYPVEMTFDGLPVFTISRPIADIKAGDIVRIDGKYGKVSEIKGSKIYMISYNGTGRTKHAVTNALLGTTNIDVVVALGANGSGDINPLMLACVMGKEDGDFDLKDFLLIQAMSGNTANINGNLLSNPLMFLLLSEKEGKEIDPMLFLLMGGAGNGNNGLSGLMSNPIALMALLGDKKGGKNDLFETMIMASAFTGGKGGLNLGNLFGGAPVATPTPAVESKAPTAKRAPRAKKVATPAAPEA
jgi:hypothetical protein